MTSKRMCKRFERLALACLLGLVLGLAWAGPAPAVENVSDAAVRDAVEDELDVDPVVSLNDVLVAVTDGVVHLEGTMPNALVVRRAERIAETVRGVRSVSNRLEVELSLRRTDQAVAGDVRTALRMDPATEKYEVLVDVTDGVVTLTGSVDSWQEKDLAEQVALGVRGVRSVNNQVGVDYEASRPDSEIMAEVRKRLRWDVLVDHALLELEVADGDVVLTGTVGSAAERSRAYVDAWVGGVADVDVSGVQVAKWARDPDMRGAKYEALSDEKTARAVRDALLYDPRVASYDLDVRVRDGEAVLRGEVDNLRARRAALSVARNTVGVLEATNRIRVGPGGQYGADELRESVEDALQRDPLLDAYRIDVTVRGDTVVLQGEVESMYEKARAHDAAATVMGVAEVRNRLDVQTGAMAYDPYVDDYDYYDTGTYDPAPQYGLAGDSELREEINDQLFWSPYVDADQVQVRVNEGVATLEGEVDTPSERTAAVAEAYEAGARWVNNELELE
jgi:osmotically-inducible protein OsmY